MLNALRDDFHELKLLQQKTYDSIETLTNQTISAEIKLSKYFLMLADFFYDSTVLNMECIITAFSLNMSFHNLLEMRKIFPRNNEIKLKRVDASMKEILGDLYDELISFLHKKQFGTLRKCSRENNHLMRESYRLLNSHLAKPSAIRKEILSSRSKVAKKLLKQLKVAKYKHRRSYFAAFLDEAGDFSGFQSIRYPRPL